MIGQYVCNLKLSRYWARPDLDICILFLDLPVIHGRLTIIIFSYNCYVVLPASSYLKQPKIIMIVTFGAPTRMNFRLDFKNGCHFLSFIVPTFGALLFSMWITRRLEILPGLFLKATNALLTHLKISIRRPFFRVKRLHWKELPSRPVGQSFHGLDKLSLS